MACTRPYWWLKCAVGVGNDDHPLARAYHRLLVWDIMKHPAATRIGRAGAQPAHRQEPGALRPQTRHRPGRGRPGRRPHRAGTRRCVTSRPCDLPCPACWTRPPSWPPAAASRRSRSRPGRSAGPMATSTPGTTSSARWRCPRAVCAGRPGGPTSGWPGQPAGRRLLAEEDGRRWRGHRSSRGEQPGRLRGGRRLARAPGHAGRRPSRPRMWPTVRKAVGFVLGLQTPRGEIAWERGARRHPGRVRAADRLLEHLPEPALRGRAGRGGWASRSPTGSSRPASSATWSRTTRRRSPTRAGSRWTGTTRCWPAPVRGPAAAARLAAGWDDFVVPGPRRPLRQRPAVGHRRRDMRAGAGAGRDRRPRPGAGAVRPHPAPAATPTAPTGRAGSSRTRRTSPASAAAGPRRRSSWPPTRWRTRPAGRPCSVTRGPAVRPSGRPTPTPAAAPCPRQADPPANAGPACPTPGLAHPTPVPPAPADPRPAAG